MSDWIAQLEQQARARFVHWDGGLWKSVIDGPGRQLAESLLVAGTPEAEARALLEGYLRLAGEGIGLGYLFPASVGANFFSLAWLQLLPRDLAGLPPASRSEALAQCWNLGENLEGSPAWLRRIFLRLGAERLRLDGLAALVTEVAGRALEPPDRKLGARARLEWIHLADEDRRFLPGVPHFLAPTVVCVHDRLRTGPDGREAVSIGVWLADPPLVLGPMGCGEEPGAPERSGSWTKELARLDPRARDPHAIRINDWCGAATLATSQFLVALRPE